MKCKSSICFDNEGNSLCCYDCQKNMMEMNRANSTVLDRLAVTFESRFDIFTLLKNVNKLPNNIKVKTDKTRAQRDYLTTL